MKDYINQCISEMVKDIDEKKQEILSMKLKEIGCSITLVHNQTLRFKMIICEIQDNKEVYYFNDGSTNGRRVVTFEFIQKPLVMNDGYQIMAEYKYY